jgi:hypothetical protein
MEQWWDRNEVELGDYTKDEVEDSTGCIPLLLERCVVDKKINLEVEAFDEIYRQATEFVRKIKIEYKPKEWDWYVEFVQPPGYS